MLGAGRAADGLLAVSAAMRDDMVALGMPAERIRVHRTGVNQDRFAPGDRAALKRAGYVEALATALRERAVPDPTAVVAADLAVLAFYDAFRRWVQDEPGPLADLVRDALRERRARRRESRPSAQGRLVADGVTPPPRGPVRGLLAIPQRLRDLEAEAHENRRLQRRVAELTDVVAELLVPLADRDEERVQELLQRYRDESFPP